MFKFLVSQFTKHHQSVFTQGSSDIVIDSNTVVDCQISIFPIVIGPPSSLSHISLKRSIIVSNNLVVGTSPNFDCLTDVPPNNLNAQYASNSVPYGANNGDRIGLVWSNFVDHGNGKLI